MSLTGGHRPDLRGRGQRRIDEAELSGRTYLGEGFQHHHAEERPHCVVEAVLFSMATATRTLGPAT